MSAESKPPAVIWARPRHTGREGKGRKAPAASARGPLGSEGSSWAWADGVPRGQGQRLSLGGRGSFTSTGPRRREEWAVARRRLLGKASLFAGLEERRMPFAL